LLVSVDLVPDELETMGEASSFYELAVLELLNLDGASLGGGAY